MTASDRTRHVASEVVFESYVALGYNYRLTDVQAAIGRAQLKRLPLVLRRRRFLAARYDHLLADIPGLQVPREPVWARSNYQSYCVRLPDGVDQHLVMEQMLGENIATRRGVMCAHREPAYAAGTWTCEPGVLSTESSAASVRLRESELAQDRTLLLPLFYQLLEAEQDRVVRSFSRACATAVTASR